MVRYATSLLLECAKRTGIPVLLIGQVTKDGNVQEEVTCKQKALEQIVHILKSSLLEKDERLELERQINMSTLPSIGIDEELEDILQLASTIESLADSLVKAEEEHGVCPVKQKHTFQLCSI